MTRSMEVQNPVQLPSVRSPSGRRSVSIRKYAEQATTATTAIRFSSRTDPSGRSAIRVATAPAISTYSQRGGSSHTAWAAKEITQISYVAQPTHCSRLSTVGAYDPERPSRPRSSTIVGAPVTAPARATAASSTQPSTVPATIATTVATNDCPGATRNVAVTGMSRLIPRFAQSPSWSEKPSGRGCCSARVAGASVRWSAVADRMPPSQPGAPGSRVWHRHRTPGNPPGHGERSDRYEPAVPQVPQRYAPVRAQRRRGRPVHRVQGALPRPRRAGKAGQGRERLVRGRRPGPPPAGAPVRGDLQLPPPLRRGPPLRPAVRRAPPVRRRRRSPPLLEEAPPPLVPRGALRLSGPAPAPVSGWGSDALGSDGS